MLGNRKPLSSISVAPSGMPMKRFAFEAEDRSPGPPAFHFAMPSFCRMSVDASRLLHQENRSFRNRASCRFLISIK
jgi:hypothetical protein